MKAVQNQQEGCVAILLAHGADPNLADAAGNTALHLAALAADTSVAGQLVEHKALVDAQNKMGCTPLALAVCGRHGEMVEFLLGKGADVNARDQSARSPLMHAAAAGARSIVDVLLRHGADLCQEDDVGWTAEEHARASGRAGAVELLADCAQRARAGGPAGVPVGSSARGAGAAGFAPGACAAAGGVGDDLFLVRVEGVDEEESEESSLPASEIERRCLAAKKRCLALGLCRDDDPEDDGRQRGVLEMQEASPDKNGEEGAGVPQDEDAAGSEQADEKAITLAAAADQEEEDASPCDSEEESPARDEEEPAGGPQAANAAGALCAGGDVPSAAAAEQQEEDDSPWDSEEESAARDGEEAPAAPQDTSGAGATACVRDVTSTAGTKKEDGPLNETCRAALGELDQERADAPRKQSLSEALLEAAPRSCRKLGEEQVQWQKELARVKGKLQESEEQRLRSERCVEELKRALSEKQSEAVASSQQEQERATAAFTIRLLKEKVGRLELENARLEVRARQQTAKVEALQKGVATSASGTLRQLEQELAEARRKQLMCEASLEAATGAHKDLEEEKGQLQRELGRLKGKLQELEEQHLQSQQCVEELKRALLEKEREAVASCQQQKASLETESIKVLREEVERLKLANKRLEGRARQHTAKMEALQKEVQSCDSGTLRQLEQELAEARRKQSVSEASLEAATRAHEDLEEEKGQLQRELDRVKGELQESREQRLQAERRVEDLETALSEKQREAMASSKQLQDLVEASLEKASIKQLEERVGRLELENVRLEGRSHQQTARIEALQQELHSSATVHKSLEDLLSAFRARHVPLEEALKKLRAYERRTRESPFHVQDRLKEAPSGGSHEVDALRAQVHELCKRLSAEQSKSRKLKKANEGLREELACMYGSHEKLQRRKRQLEEEVAALRCRAESKTMDRGHIKAYKREVEERAEQDLRRKLREVNLLLQTQAATQDSVERRRAAAEASLVGQLQQRIRRLEEDLALSRCLQQGPGIGGLAEAAAASPHELCRGPSLTADAEGNASCVSERVEAQMAELRQEWSKISLKDLSQKWLSGMGTATRAYGERKAAWGNAPSTSWRSAL